MRRLHIVSALAGSLLLLLASACGGGVAPEAAPTESVTEHFDRNNFTNSTTIDNQWFPLKPGTQFVWEGEANVDGERLPHRVVFIVTDLTKVIAGVRTVVGYDLDYSADELVEAELAFWAQDNDGNVWHLGQYPEEYEEGAFVDAPAWIHGLQGANAGISMKAEPQLGTPSYSQGWGPEVNWTDRARVFEMGQQTCVPTNCYENVLVIDEFNVDEPDAHQLKYYAPGVGNVRVGWAGAGEQEQETLELVSLVQLSPEDLARVRGEALALERRAYEISKDVYGQTPPAEHTLRAGQSP